MISALLINTSISRQAFDKALDHYRILISDETVAEVDHVAGQEKFEPHLKEGKREAFEELLHRLGPADVEPRWGAGLRNLRARSAEDAERMAHDVPQIRLQEGRSTSQFHPPGGA